MTLTFIQFIYLLLKDWQHSFETPFDSEEFAEVNEAEKVTIKKD